MTFKTTKTIVLFLIWTWTCIIHGLFCDFKNYWKDLDYMFYQTINVYMQLSSIEKYSLLVHFVYLYIYILHRQLEIFNLLKSASPLFSVRIKSFFNKPNSRHHRGSHGSFTEMHKLCNVIQDIITYFKSYIQHSVCLYKILQRPFNIP